MTDQEIVSNAHRILKEIETEINEVQELFDEYKNKDEYHLILSKLRMKVNLIQEILGIE